MKTVMRLMVIIAAGVFISGCSGKGGDQPQKSKVDQKSAQDNDKNLALKFLQGVQDGDKGKMYEAANLTKEIVAENRDKLINRDKLKQQTEQQRSEAEHALRVSGNIDFIAAKIKVLLPKSATFQITRTTSKELEGGVRRTEHSVEITYGNRAEAISDSTGKPVRVMTLALLQISRPVNGRLVNDISFDSKEFEKMAGKEFTVTSYF